MTPTLHTICTDRCASQTLLVVTAKDLLEFAAAVAHEVKKQFEPEYFTRQELLDYLGVSSRTLWGYEHEGIITAEKVGRQKRYNKAVIYAAVQHGDFKPLKK